MTYSFLLSPCYVQKLQLFLKSPDIHQVFGCFFFLFKPIFLRVLCSLYLNIVFNLQPSFSFVWNASNRQPEFVLARGVSAIVSPESSDVIWVCIYCGHARPESNVLHHLRFGVFFFSSFNWSSRNALLQLCKWFIARVLRTFLEVLVLESFRVEALWECTDICRIWPA